MLARMPSPRVVVILNPASGRGAGGAAESKIRAALDGIGCPDAEIWKTSHSGHAVDLAQEAVSNGVERICAAGGDGTVAEVLRGMFGSGAVLGIIPVGTGNDFVRTIGIPKDIEKAVEIAVKGDAKPVDVGQVNGLPFINLCACGFDAVVGERINKGFKYLRGTAAYIAAVFTTLVKFKASNFRVEVDGQVHESRAMLCCVANAMCYGGGMMVAPMANVSDGQFDVVMVEEVGKIQALALFSKVFKGGHIGDPKVKTYKGSQVKISCEPPLPVLCDGELIGPAPAEFVMCSERVLVAMP